MGQTLGSLFKKEGKKSEKDTSEGLLSSFEAISGAIGGSVGVANIGGVATAIAYVICVYLIISGGISGLVKLQ